MNNAIRALPILAIICVAALASCAADKKPEREARPLPELSLRLADDIVFEIDPRIELLAGVQSQTSWVKTLGAPQGAASAYYAELKARFAPLAKGRAVRESQWLTSTGFSYDAPCAMVMSLDGGEAFRPPEEGWSEYLKGRAWGAWRLDSLSAALAEAYDAADFRGFLAAHEAAYRRWLGEEAAGFEGKEVSAWLRSFYGAKGNIVFHFVFAPAMFPGGGYGFSRSIASGGSKMMEVYQIVRAQGAVDGQPAFPSGKSLGSLALHEFGHSFVNPALAAGANDTRLARIFKPVSKAMAKQAYPTVPVFLNEMTIRAATILGERTLGILSDSGVQAAIRAERRLGFYPIGRAIALLEDYETRRDRYPDFASFAPAYLAALAAEADAIVAEGAKDGYGSTAAEKPAAVASFAESFEGPVGANGLPGGFVVDVGAQSGSGSGAESSYGVDAKARGEGPGGAALELEANSATSVWYCVQKPIAVKKGKLGLSYKAKAEDIHTESGQFGGSYVGFIVGYKDGTRRFAAQTHSGSFGWRDFSREEAIDPAKVESIEFTVFLNESGALWTDDIEVGYR
jgi:hypothetical protein